MPELPEIESLRRYLIAKHIPDRTITDLSIHRPIGDVTINRVAGISSLIGQRIKSVERHGKQLYMPIDRGLLGLHMGMTGQLIVLNSQDQPSRYARVEFFLDDGRRIELEDARRWASAQILDNVDRITDRLGPDALDPALTSDRFISLVMRRRSSIKSVLIDQSILAGVGNIYADEALFTSGISPERRANRISILRLTRLHKAVQTTLRLAIDYIEKNSGGDGRPFIVDAYDSRMKLGRVHGSRCPRCTVPLRSKKVGGRTTYYCRLCQR